MKLSGFADEIAADLEQQCLHMRQLGSRYLDFRSAWEINVSAMTDERIDEAAHIVAANDLRVACVGSPVGKAPVRGDLAEQVEKLRRCIAAAHRFDTPYVRIFSLYIPEGEAVDPFRDDVLQTLGRFTEVALAEGVILLHENEVGTFGDVPRRCLDLVRTIASPNFRLLIDPGNFVLSGAAPYDDAFVALKDHVDYVQIKDTAVDGKAVPAGEGAGQIREIVAALRERAYDGFLSLEPHLGHSSGFGGFSGPAAFERAWRALVGILDDERVVYE